MAHWNKTIEDLLSPALFDETSSDYFHFQFQGDALFTTRLVTGQSMPMCVNSVGKAIANISDAMGYSPRVTCHAIRRSLAWTIKWLGKSLMRSWR